MAARGVCGGEVGITRVREGGGGKTIVAHHRKNPSLKDYAGDNYVRNCRYRTKLKKENVGSFRCRDCQALRYVTPIEWRRAAKPRCIRCGGPLEETPASEQRTYGTKTERKLRDRAMQEDLRHIAAQVVCQGCGARFEDCSFLLGHLRANSECVEDYRVRLAGPTPARSYHCLAGTAFIQRRHDGSTYRAFWVQAIRADGQELVVIERCQLRADAQEFVQKINGPDAPKSR